MPAQTQEQLQRSLTMRRKELFAKYPDAVFLKTWVIEEAERQHCTVGTIRNKLTRRQLQPKIVSLNGHEKYVIP
jgi:hypothetical protein